MTSLESQGAANPGPVVVHNAASAVYAWSMLHGSWLLNRFAVHHHGRTSYELATNSKYVGQVCEFGEIVLGYLKPHSKGSPTWLRGVWLGKVHTNDAHIVALQTGIFVTRSVRRLAPPDNWNADMVKNLDKPPWEYGYTNLGARMVPNSRVKKAESPQISREQILPDAAPLSALLPSIPEVVDEGVLDDEAGTESSSSASSSRRSSGMVADVQSPAVVAPPLESESMETETERTAGQTRPAEEPSERPDKKARVEGGSPSRLIPPFFAGTAGEASARCLIGGEEFHHVDEIITPHFEDEELGYLEEYHSSLKDLFSPLDQSPEFEGEVSGADAELLELCVQYSENEPDLGVLELLELDKKSNAFEIKRLCTMGVLEPVSEVPADASELSTRYVNTWRAKKIAGEMRWLRRSRFVAREFASEDVNRQGLFAPATSSLVTRVIPSVWANYRSKGWFLGCLDIKDAYLTVHQQSFRVVTLEENGERKHFVLHRCLPGQRDGAALWYQDFHDFLVSRMSADASVVCPTLFRSVDEAGELRMVAMVHVDDMNFAVSPQFKDEFLGTLMSVYDVSCDILEESGEFWFLKRRHHLLADGSLAMSPNQMHFAKLFELMELYPGVHKPKRTPCHPSIQEVDQSPQLGQHLATLYRTCVGVLLYLASDLFSCQFAIKCLAQGMSKPTENLFRCLKHLVQYIMGITGYHLVHLEPRADDVRGLLGYRYEGRSHVLEIFCDSDWAGSKSTRRSTSSAVFAYQGNVIHTSCRGQKVVSLFYLPNHLGRTALHFSCIT